MSKSPRATLWSMLFHATCTKRGMRPSPFAISPATSTSKPRSVEGSWGSASENGAPPSASPPQRSSAAIAPGASWSRSRRSPTMRAMEFGMIQTRAARAMGLFALVTFAIVMLAIPRITQDQRYHDFAGPRSSDVYSNGAFLLASLAGFVVLRRAREGGSPAEYTFFLGPLATCLGSTWYHLAPNDARLVYDPLGMIICFAAILATLL